VIPCPGSAVQVGGDQHSIHGDGDWQNRLDAPDPQAAGGDQRRQPPRAPALRHHALNAVMVMAGA